MIDGLECVKCSTKVENKLLCDKCSKEDIRLGEAMSQKVCNGCDIKGTYFLEGLCNTCLSKKDDNDVIKWPKHYNTGKIQPIEAIEDWKLDFRLANAVKYIARCEHKGKAKQDLEKAIWYIERYIKIELNKDVNNG